MNDFNSPAIPGTASGRIPMKSGVRKGVLPQPARLSFRSRLQAMLAPNSYDVDAQIPNITNALYDNDKWNNCVLVTRAHHARRLFYKSTNSLIDITTTEVDDEYFAENKAENNGAFDDSQGLDFQDSLNTWLRGWNVAGQNLRIHNFQGIRFDKGSIQSAIFGASGTQVILHLPNGYNVNYGTGTWDDTSLIPSNSGFFHCMLLTAYDANTVTGITWGVRQSMTWAFLASKIQSAVKVSI